MEYVRLGRSGLRVSRLALGGMSFGVPGPAMNWTLDEHTAAPLFASAVDLGMTFWDTANAYSQGSSEEIIGRAVRTYSRRELIVLATKIFYPMHPGPGGSGLSRKAVLEQVDGSLARLGTDYIDLLQIHRFDPDVPVGETMQALHDVVTAGKVRYLGASSMWTWQFAKMQHAAAMNGWTTFISMQDQYNLVHREEEREMFGLLADQGVASVPWSPLGGGVLARPWGTTSSPRAQSNGIGQPSPLPSDEVIVDAVQRIAAARGVAMASVAIAWVLRNPVVAAPIIGATKQQHLLDAATALELALDDDEVDALERAYTPRQPTHFQ